MGQDLSKHVDEFMEEVPQFKEAVQFAYDECGKTISGGLEAYQLLGACQLAFETIMDSVDPKWGKLCLRLPTQEDIDEVIRKTEIFSRNRSLNLTQFEAFVRDVFKRVALERGKRVGMYMLGGFVAVCVAKGIIRRVPLVGRPVNFLASMFLPTFVLGPAVGIAGAVYLETP
eukprot:TRINITY_DN5607_c0_g1_i1.p2 TRINITY_DN5607_c0_g1~~TRINITY_DN5607_c0_g1_i1.p2  ORF type:complete len:172 (-),score=27.82 TRINITY_DN5607_c0_g1_i1:496-1011(-)